MYTHFSLFGGKASHIQKLVVLLIALTFIVTPLAPAFGQSASTSQSTQTTESVPTTESGPTVIENTTQTQSSEIIQNQPTTEEQGIDEGTQGQSSLLSSGDAGNLDVSRYTYDSNRLSDIDELSGTYSFQVPIIVPPGRNGVQPQLALQYSSQPQSEVSEVGYGWSLSIPSIERINRRGTNNMFTDTYFVSSLSGELASTSATTYKAKVENGGFLTYSFTGNTWMATDTVGTVYKFGTSTYSRLDHPSNTATTSRWMLEEMKDRNGNYITYSYYKEAGQIYPRKITYTHSTSSTGIFEVEFNRQSRSDTASTSAVGFPISTKERISEIVTKINGTWARKYALGYATSTDNRTRSRLASVTEYGRADDGSTTTRPAYNFSYQESGVKHWNTDNSWSIPVYIAHESGESLGTVIADANGDGRPDLLHSLFKTTGTNEQSIYLNSGTSTGWTLSSTWVYPWSDSFTSDFVTKPFFPADLNADGYDDFVYSGTTLATSSTYINTHASWASSTSWQVPTPFQNATGSVNTRLIDVNGDGLPDILKADRNGNINLAYTNTGFGWATSSTWLSPQYFIGTSTNSDLGVVFLELNGDGLPDMIRSYRASTSEPDIVTNIAYTNTGSGWATSSTWINPHFATNHLPVSNEGLETGFRFVDINADGGSDIVQGCSCGPLYIPDITTYLNTNMSWATVTSEWNFPSGFTGTTGLDSGGRMLDLDGDMLPDLLFSRKGYSTDSKRVDFNASNQVDVLSRIEYPQGGVTEVSYKTSHEYRDSTTNTPLNTTLPFPILTVATTTDYDSVGNRSTSAYSYEGGRMYWNSPYDKKFAGFNSITKTDPKGNVTKTFYHQASTTESSLGEYDDHVSKIGKAYRVEQYDNASNLYAVSINKWDKTDLGQGRYFVKLAENLNLNYEGDIDHRDTLTTFNYASGTGNVVEKINWGEVTGSTTGTYTDIGTDKYSTRYTYATNTTYGITALPATETVVDQSGTTVRQSRFYYDLLSLGSTTKGNLTKQEMLKSGSTYIDVEKTYSGQGLVLTEKDPRDKTTTYTYDSYNLYPATTTNPVSHVTGRQFDYSSGKVKITNDPNTRVFETTYDGFDRPLTETQPDITTPGTLVTKSTYSYTDTSFPTKIQRTDYLNSATTTDSYVYFDGFGKKIEERAEARGTNTYTVKDFFYDKRGLIERESLLYYASSTTYTATSSAPANALYVLYAYDPLGRVKTMSNVVGTTTTTYDDWSATTTDAIGNIKSYVKDASGNLVTVGERNGTSTYITQYIYDGNNKLTKITDAEGNIRNFTYDLLGRRLTAQDLHDSADGTFGTWTYAYDDASNIGTTTDPKSQIVVYTYDNVNRPLTENYTGGAGTEVSYAYDSCTNGKGRLCSATTTDAITRYTYNVLGAVATEQKVLNSTTYTTSYGYDRLGNKSSITYPDNTQAKYTYSPAGQLSAVDYLTATGTSTSILSNIDYGPHGAMTVQRYGNGATTTREFDANELYRLRSITTVASSTGVGGGGSELRLLEATLAPTEFSEFLSESTTTEVVPEVLDEDITLETVPEINISTTTASDEPEIVEEATTSPEVVQQDSESTGEDTILQTAITEALVSEPTTTPELPVEQIAIATTSPTTTEMIIEIANAPITQLLQESTPDERAQIKAHALASLVFKEPYIDTEHNLQIEVIAVSEIEQGIQVFARAWRDGKQIGFGENGTVEIERFLIYNPPILVPDPQGSIHQTGMDSITGVPITRTLREDLPQALMQTLVHIISVKQEAVTNSEIIPGKVGNTTSTFYPDAHPETTTVDGYTLRNGGNATWSSVRDNAGTGASDNAVNIPLAYLISGTSNWSQMYRSLFLFDTASIPDTDIVSSATVSFYGQSKINNTGNNMEAYIVSSNPSSNTAIIASDYSTLGTTRLSDTDIAYASFSLAAYNNYTLNAAGTNTISKTGITKLGARGKADFNNAEPADRLPNSSEDGIQVWEADQTGSTQDPVLVVEHSAPPLSPKSIQRQTYIYDVIGNIVAIANTSDLATQGTTTYTYDNLSRLLSASTTQASSTPFKHSYTYSPIGNMTGMATTGATTTYTYSETGSTNPSAPTSIGSGSLTYDTNGNLTAYNATKYTWDYRNRVTAIGNGTATTTFAYDHTFERVKKVSGGVSTYYINDLYNKAGATTTIYIYDNTGTLIATIEGNGSATTTEYQHQDHLGGTNVITNALANVVTTMDYYPYGDTRISSGSFTSKRNFIGEVQDLETDLNYLNARYYDSGRGQFLSQDPVFWEVGESDEGVAVLFTPQLQNTYSYGGNSPVVNKDPSGRIIDTVIDIGFIVYDLYKVGSAYASGGDVRAEIGYLGADVVGAMIPGGTGFGVIARTAKVADKADDSYTVYRGFDKVTGELKYTGITKRDPDIRFTEHRAAKGSGRENLRYEILDGTGNLNKSDARLIEQSIIDSNGMQKTGGALVNKQNSISPQKVNTAYKSASRSIQKASDAIKKGDHDTASKYLKKASNSLKKQK
jgi:RHS repeat-associated protein